MHKIGKAHFMCITLIHNLFLEEARASIRVLTNLVILPFSDKKESNIIIKEMSDS